MKTAVLSGLIGLIISPAFAFAQAKCDHRAEAQIHALRIERKTDNLTYCKAEIKSIADNGFTPNPNCPLQLDDVLALGVEFRLMNGHDCEIPARGVSGIIYMGADGRIYLE